MMRTYMKKTIAAIVAGNKEVATIAYSEIQSILDRMATKGLIHKNKAARNKANLIAKIKAM
ncbi:SSU ribosomal protein S20p [Candidatus Enterovibrio escicola]|uniref:Small ribosomal subunit protein bS20 n=2 Tax=Candidatus Enterovibrio escicola TaxID=1927127 RepID=A0A2A5T5X9_9GAMM|nr:SSU ribosomal protein S20p [Candidatus Enterovibrio escacola]